MLNIFEQPWTMIGVAFLSLIVIFVYRAVYPQKQRSWQLLIPVLIALLGLSLDYFVKTDYEKIDSLLNTAISSVADQTTDVYQQIISDNYTDSSRRTKTELLAYRQALLSQNVITSCKKTGVLINPPSNNLATAMINATITLNRSLSPELDGLNVLLVEAKAYLQKEPDKIWRIQKTEILELNNQPVSWKDMR